MGEICVDAEYYMLQGEMNRMFLTEDVAELVKMRESAKKRIEKIYEYHHARLNNK